VLPGDADRAKQETARLEAAVAAVDERIRALTAAASAQRGRVAFAQHEADKFPASGDDERAAQTAYEQAIQHERQINQQMAQGGAGLQELEEAQVTVRVAADNLTNARHRGEAEHTLEAAQAEQARLDGELTIASNERARAADALQASRAVQEQTEAAVETAADRAEAAIIAAPAGGIVSAVGVVAGDRVAAGATVVEIAAMDRLVAELQVPAAVVNTLTRGQAARLHVDGNGAYDARVSSIAPLPTPDGMHVVELEVPNPGGVLIAGHAARVEFAGQP
jgi:multidrug resistance efflux pump